MMEVISVSVKPRHVAFLEREAEARDVSSRSAVVRDMLDARIKENKVVLPLRKGAKRYLEEVSRDLGVPIHEVLHCMILVYRQIEWALAGLFHPRREAILKFVRDSEFPPVPKGSDS